MSIKLDSLKQIQPLELVNSIWSDRRNSNLIKWLMQQSCLSAETMADFLGIKVSVFNNKLNRGTFSFHELLIAAYACDISFLISDDTGLVTRRIDPQAELGEESAEWIRISALKEKTTLEQKRTLYEVKIREYRQLEKDLAQLKQEIENKI